MGSQQLYSLSWGEFGTSLTSTVQTLRNHNEMVDVTLAAGGKIFAAHKLVLSSASPLLMQLLKSTNCHHPVLMLAGITAPDLEALLQFVYQGEVSVDSSQLPSLLQAAHCLDIQALSPQTLTAEKNLAMVSVPSVMTDSVREINIHTTTSSRDMNMTPQPQTSRDLAPLMPVRKRKRKQSQSSETESLKWGISDGVGVTTVEAQQLESVSENHSEDTKEGIMDDQHSNSETAVKKLVSDLPVECTVCGVTLRQSRNLRRHMELIHLKAESGGVKLRKGQHLVKDETKKVEDEGVQSVQTMTEQHGVEHSTVTSRLPVLPPPPTTTHLQTLPLPNTNLNSSSTSHLLTSPPTTHLLDPPPSTNLPTSSPTTHLTTPPTKQLHNPPLTTHFLTSSPTTHLTSTPTKHLHNPPPTTHLLTSSPTAHLASPLTTHLHNHTPTTHLFTSSPTTHLTSTPTKHLHNPPPITHLLTSSPTAHLASPLTTHLHNHTPTTHLLTSSPTTHLTSPPSKHLHNPPPTTHLTSSPTAHLASPPTTHHNPPPTTHLLTSSSTTHLTSPPNTHLLTSPPMYHSSVQCDPYPPSQTTHSLAQTHTMQYTHDVYRQQHSDILRGAGLYAGTREHCTTE